MNLTESRSFQVRSVGDDSLDLDLLILAINKFPDALTNDPLVALVSDDIN